MTSKMMFSTSSLQTIKELSKSIQRSNDKRKGEVLELSNTIMKASDRLPKRSHPFRMTF